MTSKWLALIILGIPYLPSDCLRSFIIKWKNPTIDVNSSLIASQNIILSNQNNISTFDVYIIFKDELYNVTVTCTIDIVQSDGSLKRVFEYSLDICKSFRMANKKNVATILWNEVQGLGHMPSSCPIPANENFTINNYHIDPQQFPPYTPALTFKVGVVFLVSGQDSFAASIVGAIESKQKRRPKI